MLNHPDSNYIKSLVRGHCCHIHNVEYWSSVFLLNFHLVALCLTSSLLFRLFWPANVLGNSLYLSLLPYWTICLWQFLYLNLAVSFSPHLWWNENVQVISPSWWQKKKTWTSMRSSDVLAWLVSCHSLLIYWFRMIGSISWTIEMSYMFSCCLIWTKLNYCEFSKFISE
jgi:hypothetical protein